MLEKETLVKLIILCGVPDATIRSCTHLGVTVEEVEREYERIFTEQDGRMDI